jgi:hypothetical protein
LSFLVLPAQCLALAAPDAPCLLGDRFDEIQARFKARSFKALTSDLDPIATESRAFIEQVLVATGAADFAQACDSTDSGIIYTFVFSGPDLPAQSYRAIYFRLGTRLEQGVIFAGDASRPYARIVDSRIVDCRVR